MPSAGWGAVGDRAGRENFRRGRALSLADALTYALEERRTPPPPSSEPTPLSRRERQVAALVAQGLTNKEIATQLVIAQRTAEGHVERILTELGFTNRTQIATWLADHPSQVTEGDRRSASRFKKD